jgi:hypothetical protein
MFLKDVESWLKRGQIAPFFREKRPRKKYATKYNAASGIIAGELLTGFRLWRQYWRQLLGSLFLMGVSPSKMGPFAPFLATIQRLLSARAFLSPKCFVWAVPSLLRAHTYFI